MSRSRFEVGPEMPEPRVEYGPDESDITFFWNGSEFTLARRAAFVGVKIMVELWDLNQQNPDWLVLEVIELEEAPPTIKKVVHERTLRNIPKVTIQADIDSGIRFQAFLKN